LSGSDDTDELMLLGPDEAFEQMTLPRGGEAAALSVRSPAKSTANEDAAAIIAREGGAVLAVADGMGGRPGGADAAATAVRTLARTLAEARRAGSPMREAILEGLERANREVIGLAAGSAATLAVVDAQDMTARAYHVGDAGVLVLGGRGRLRLQTVAHSPVGYALEAGLLDERGAMAHGARHFVSNIVGDASMHIEVSAPISLRPRDTVVLASDGLFDNLFTDEIVAMAQQRPLERAVHELADTCLARMRAPTGAGQPHKPDDLTIVAFRPGRAVQGD
jgi:serine/threonine protein phosphatase PrpC